MGGRASYDVNYDVIYGYTLKANGIVRRDMRRVCDQIVAQARINIVANSRARHPIMAATRTGKLALGIGDSHRWANQHGAARDVTASAFSPSGWNYAEVVHNGYPGWISHRKKMPVGLSQGNRRGPKLFRVRGQIGNPYLADALEEVLRRNGYL